VVSRFTKAFKEALLEAAELAGIEINC